MKNIASVKSNLIANCIGQMWGALMGLAFVPVYLRYIGAEGYGLVGFFVMLSASLTILDAGLGTAATRESAAYGEASNQRRTEIAVLLRSIELIFWLMSLILGCVLFLLSPYIVKYWLNVPVQSIPDTTSAIRWMVITVAVQFSLSFYGGCLNGLQQQVGLNIINAVGATLRGAGAVVVLWLVSPTTNAFFIWQAIGGVGMFVAQKLLFNHSLGSAIRNINFSSKSIMQVKDFVVGNGLINILAFLLTQLDKVILSRFLSLKLFGYYSLAWTLGTLVYRLTGPIFNAYYPKITQQMERGEKLAMMTTYHQATRVMAVMVVPVSMWLAIFSNEILVLWTRDPIIANESAPALSVIALGTMCNAFMHIPYALQLAHKYTKLTLIQNVMSVLIMVPLTWYFATNFGIAAAALPWFLVNFGYVVIGTPIMHRLLSLPGLGRWYVESVIVPVALVGIGMFSFNRLMKVFLQFSASIVIQGIVLGIGLLIVLIYSGLLREVDLGKWKNIL